MKLWLILMVVMAFLLLPSVQGAAIQTDTTLFNITVSASGYDNFTSDIQNTTYKVLIGEPVVGNVTTGTSQFKFGFFHAQHASFIAFVASTNQAPILPIWIFPQNNTAILDDTLVLLQYSSSDPDGDPITYYVYQNDTFIRTSDTNISVILENGSYNFTVAAFDGSLYSANATTTFKVDVPVAANLDWALPVALLYLGGIAVYLFFGFTLKDKQLEQFISKTGMIRKEVVNPAMTILKSLYYLSIPAIFLMGFGLGITMAETAGASSESLSIMNLTFIIFSVIYTITIFLIGFMALLKSYGTIVDSFKGVTSIKVFRTKRGGKT